MRTTPLRFEALQHRLDDHYYLIPLLMDENRIPAHSLTVPLLRAAEILAPKLEDTQGQGLDELVVNIGTLAATGSTTSTEGNSAGVVIEDEHGAGAIVVREKVAAVNMRGGEEFTFPTAALFDMIYCWKRLKEAAEAPAFRT